MTRYLTNNAWKPIFLGALCLALAFLAGLCAHSPAHAEEAGTIDLGIDVSSAVVAPEAGSSGTVDLGIDVGHAVAADGTEQTETGGAIDIGIDVANRTTFAVTFSYGDGSTEDKVVSGVERGSLLAEPDDPKRLGYEFKGWHVGSPDGSPWDFGKDQVLGDTTLCAKWKLHISVTVPISLTMSVNADTKEAITPDMGAFAVKSRTVAPVQVEEVAVASEEGELKGFFIPKDADPEEENPLAPEDMRGTTLWLATDDCFEEGVTDPFALPDADREPGAIALDLAGDEKDGAYTLASKYVLGDGAPDEDGNPVGVAGERERFSIEAFDPARLADGSASNDLPLKFGLKIDDKLDVILFGQERPITHLVLTVSVRDA